MTNQRLEAEIRQGQERLDRLRDETNAVKLKVSDQKERLNQVEERLKQSTFEIKGRDVELQQLQKKLEANERRYSFVLGNEDGADPIDVDQVTLEQATKFVEERFNDVKVYLQPEDGEDDNLSRNEAVVNHATVEFNGHFFSFRLVPSYTFDELKEDACNLWDVDPAEATLRDVHNMIWPRRASVQTELSHALIETRSSGYVLPKIRLIGRSRAKSNASTAPKSSLAPATTSDIPPKSSKSVTFGAPTTEYQIAKSVTEDDAYGSTVTTAKIRRAQHLSAAFHDPHNINHETGPVRLYRSLEAYAGAVGYSKSKRQVKMLSLCLQFLVYLAFLSFLLVGMVYRFNIAHRYSGYYSLTEALTLPRFNEVPPINFAGNLVDRRFHAVAQQVEPSKAQAYYGFGQLEDTWAWLEQVVTPSLYDNPMTENRLPHAVNSQQVLTGPVRIRQLRVADDRCSLNDMLPIRGVTCSAPYARFVRASGPYGPAAYPNETYATLSAECMSNLGGDLATLAFEEASPLPGEPFVRGRYATYGSEGYAMNIPAGASSECVVQLLEVLKQNNWLDRSSRAVVVRFSLANVNMNWFMSNMLVVEFSNSGATHTSQSISSASLSVYFPENKLAFGLIVTCDAILLLYSFFLVYHLVVDIYIFGFFVVMKTIWNIVSLLEVLLVFTQFSLSIVYETAYARKLVFPPADSLEQQDLHLGLVRTYTALLVISCCVMVLGFLLVFRLTQSNRQVSRVWQTLANARYVIGAYLFGGTMVLLGLVFCGYFVWGGKLAFWSSVQLAAVQTLGILTGNINYETLRDTDVVFATVVAVVWVFVVYFVLFQIIGAVIIDSYFEISAVGITGEKDYFWRDLVLSPFVWCTGKAKSRSRTRQRNKSKRKKKR